MLLRTLHTSSTKRYNLCALQSVRDRFIERAVDDVSRVLRVGGAAHNTGIQYVLDPIVFYSVVSKFHDVVRAFASFWPYLSQFPDINTPASILIKG